MLVSCGVYYEYEIDYKSGVTLRSETGNPECVRINALTQGAVMEEPMEMECRYLISAGRTAP